MMEESKATAAPSLIGRVIGGYRLVRLIGVEGTSAVLVGEHVEAPEQMAVIKILLLPATTPYAPHTELRMQFMREAQSLFALQHPHAVSVSAVGRDVVTGSPYMVLPYPQAETLAERLSGGPLPLATAARYLAQLAGALDTAVSLGLVHGEITPSNILVDQEDQAYLTGFGGIGPLGIAVDVQASAVAVGDAAYMAPERAYGDAGQGVTPTSDLYGLGVVLYQMVTGYVPFQGATRAIVLLQHAQLPPPPPRMLRADLPVAAEAAMLRALAKQPTERFPSATAFAEAFALGVAGQAATVGPLPQAGTDEPDVIEPAGIESVAVVAPVVVAPVVVAPATDAAEVVPLTDATPEPDEPVIEAPAAVTPVDTAPEPDEPPHADVPQKPSISASEPVAARGARETPRPSDPPRSVPVVTAPAVAPTMKYGDSTHTDSAHADSDTPVNPAPQPMEQAPISDGGETPATAATQTDVGRETDEAQATTAVVKPPVVTVAPLVGWAALVRNVMLAFFALAVGAAAIAVLHFLGIVDFVLAAVVIALFIYFGIVLPARWAQNAKGQAGVGADASADGSTAGSRDVAPSAAPKQNPLKLAGSAT